MAVRGIAPDATADSIVIGNPVTGGGANRVLYEDPSQNLGSEAAFTYDQTTNTLAADVLSGSLSGTVAGGTWAAVSATTPANGTVRWVTDVGRNGSLWIYNSTDVRWRPLNGSVSLFATAIPMVLPSSGSIGDNGALTGLTALPVQFASCYMYFPASAISAGSAAGLYYVVMSSTTAGTIYNNTYTSGLPTIPASPTAFVTTGPGAYTQTTASDIMLLSFTVQGGLMGINGALRSVSAWGVTNNANAKTAKEKYGGTATFSFSLASTAANQHFGVVRNVGVSTTQSIHSAASAGGIGISSVGYSQVSVASASDQAFSLTAQLATATDYMLSGGLTVELSTQ